MKKIFCLVLFSIFVYESAVFDVADLSQMTKDEAELSYDNWYTKVIVEGTFSLGKNVFRDVFDLFKDYMETNNSKVCCVNFNSYENYDESLYQRYVRDVFQQNILFVHTLYTGIFNFDGVGFSYATRGEKNPFTMRLYSKGSSIIFCMDPESDFRMEFMKVPYDMEYNLYDDRYLMDQGNMLKINF